MSQFLKIFQSTNKGICVGCSELHKKEEANKNPLQEKEQRKGCYIATCVYGSYDCSEVWVLRRYRDGVLEFTFLGRMFIKLYYAISPMLVEAFGKRSWFKNFFKS